MEIPAKLEFEGDVDGESSAKFTALAQDPFRADVLSIHPCCGDMYIENISIGLESQLVEPVPASAFAPEHPVHMATAMPGVVVAITVRNPNHGPRRFMAVLWGRYHQQ